MTDLLHGRDYFQHRPPPGLDALPEEAVDGAGTAFRGARARVYHLLRIVGEHGISLPVGRHHGPPGWVPRHFLVEPWSGGAEGARRVRELAGRHGFAVEHTTFDPPDGDSSATTLYRLVPGGTGAASAPARPQPLAGLDFHTAVGTAVDLAAHGCPLHLTDSWLALRPPPDLAGDADWCSAQYREHLLAAYREGSLVGQLEQRGQIVLYLLPGRELGFDPFPTLRRALTALGARDLGHLGPEWSA